MVPVKEFLQEITLPDQKLLSRGKVRHMFELPDNRLLMVSSDRLSAFDVVFPTPIPRKGRILNQMSAFWFEWLVRLWFVGGHVTCSDWNVIKKMYPDLEAYGDILAGRSMVVKRLKMIPAEGVVRGYLVGSGWQDYRKTGEVCGIKLPKGLKEGDKLPEPIFTPATKATDGHDINISFNELARRINYQTASLLRNTALHVYDEAFSHAEQRGVLILDTKIEIGAEIVTDPKTGEERYGDILVGDELLTPDSSRFALKSDYENFLSEREGNPKAQIRSLDKQYVRDWLNEIGWDRQPPAPELPESVVERTMDRYLEAFRLITGGSLA